MCWKEEMAAPGCPRGSFRQDREGGHLSAPLKDGFERVPLGATEAVEPVSLALHFREVSRSVRTSLGIPGVRQDWYPGTVPHACNLGTQKG